MTASPTARQRAAWVFDTLRSACAPGACDPASLYASSALPASEAAWRHFDAGETRPPRAMEDGLLDFGDGIPDVIASAFWHLSRWEERAAPRDRHGRFAGASSLTEIGRAHV